MPRILPRRVRPEEEISVVGHLDELRRRIFVAAAALIAAFALAWVEHARLLELLLQPIPAQYRRLLALSPTEPFITTLKVSLAAAVLLALPVVLYQLYAYLAPGVNLTMSRGRSLLAVAAVAALFSGGVVFGYAVVLPVALDFLLGFGGGDFEIGLRAAEYLSFSLTLLLATGLLFEVPAAMVALTRLGWADADRFRKGRRIAIVAAAALAAALPGGDPVSMLLLMAPQVLLYEAGIVLSRAFAPKAEPAFGASGIP